MDGIALLGASRAVEYLLVQSAASRVARQKSGKRNNSVSFPLEQNTTDEARHIA
jgi:hypothetical protein